MTAEDRSEFCRTLEDLAAQSIFAETLLKRAQADRHEWGLVDGKFVERFTDLLRATDHGTAISMRGQSLAH